MRRTALIVTLTAVLILPAALVAHRARAVAQDGDSDFPEDGVPDMKSYLRRLQTRSGANWVLQHGTRAFVVRDVLDDAAILVELETNDGEPLETSDSTPAADRVKAIWKHGKSEPSTFKRIGTYMVPFSAILRVSHRSLEGHEVFTIKLVGLD